MKPGGARDAIKTIEGWRDHKRVREFLRGHQGTEFFVFNVGRGRPQQAIARLFFVFRGRILGWFAVDRIDENLGQFDAGSSHELKFKLTKDWSPARFVFVCRPPFHFIKARILHEGFRGWRYFDFEVHRNSLDAKVRI